MRSRQILSVLLKRFDMNFHIDESDGSFNTVMFDKKNNKVVARLSDITLTYLLKKASKEARKYLNTKPGITLMTDLKNEPGQH